MNIDEVARAFERPKRQADGSYMVRCPAHDDQQASLHISTGKDGGILLHCHAGCLIDDIMHAAGLEWKDLTPPAKKQERRVVAVYPYTDESGELLYETVRFEPKDFRQRVPDGRGGYTWSLKGVRRVLYKLHTLAGAIATGMPILFVEGEKDADNLIALGMVATTSPMGAGKFLPEYADSLRGASAVMLPDNDDTGREHMQKAAALLYGVAKAVRIIDLREVWPELPQKGDVSDVIQALGGGDALYRLGEAISAAPLYEPPEALEHSGDLRLEIITATGLQAAELPPPVFIVKNLLTAGLAAVIAAPKFGKSWLVLQLCIAIASGMPFIGYETVKGGCLYLALEDTQRRLQDRMNKLLNGAPAPDAFDFATSAHDIDNGLIEQLTAYIREHPAVKLIVIDTLQKVKGRKMPGESAYDADYRAMSPLKALADANKLCIMVVHHTRKMDDDTDPFNRISGTNGLLGSLDTAILLTREKRSDADTEPFPIR